jgi:hypothetical protein
VPADPEGFARLLADKGVVPVPSAFEQQRAAGESK